MASIPHLPEQFGRYRIVRKLGEGGMGAVYLAEDSELGRRVAIKVPRFTRVDGRDVIERFKREARAAAALRHPNLCPVYEVGHFDGIHYLTMPFIEGTSLANRIHHDQPWPPAQAVALVLRLAQALHVLHQRGMMHRDLKPSNIMLEAGDEPVIMDFGLARSVSQNDRMTTTGVAVGTPAYMSPEQFLADPKAVTNTTDMWSLGVIFYRLLTGHLPFRGPTNEALYGQILHAALAPPSALRPELDVELDAICHKALAKRASERYPTMSEFAAALQGYLRVQQSGFSAQPSCSPGAVDAALTVTLPPPNSPMEGKELRRRTGRWRRTLRAAGVGTAVVVLGLLMWLLVGGPGGEPSRQDAGPLEPKAFTNSIGMQFVPIPVGRFWMGSDPNEHPEAIDMEFPRHGVHIGKCFFLAAHKTTQGQFEQVLGRQPSWFSASGVGKNGVAGLVTGRFPVESVSFFEAVEFCNKLSEREGLRPCYRLVGNQVESVSGSTGYRLPTEAEWEYCARAGTTTRYWFGEDAARRGDWFAGYWFGEDAARIGEYAWFSGNSGSRRVRTQLIAQAIAAQGFASPGAPSPVVSQAAVLLGVATCDASPLGSRTHPVGEKPANVWGLYDMHGNVWEWCEDVWHDKYQGAPTDGSAWLVGGDATRRVVRGGSWRTDAWDCRSARRLWYGPGGGANNVGFRVVRVSP
jgi:formylglycine-generating enzyme required for sulfatase activity/tRNA A-37 threonylcarbamoyl transferase component Bud32